MNTNSVAYLTELDVSRIGENLADLREETQRLAKSTNDLVISGIRKEEEIGCEDPSSGFSCKLTQMRKLHELLKIAEVVRMPSQTENVALGNKVTILRDGERQSWEIVGHMQSHSDMGFTAYDTPLGKLLLGRKVGDKFSEVIGEKKSCVEVLAIEVANGKLDH